MSEENDTGAVESTEQPKYDLNPTFESDSSKDQSTDVSTTDSGSGQQTQDSIQQQVDDGQVEASGEQNSQGEDLYTVTVNGEETQVTFQELQKAYNSKKESARLAQEAQQVRNQSESLIRQLQQDPMSVLKDDRIMGNNKLRETVENWLLEQYQYENLSDEEREQMEMRQRLQQYEEQERQRKQQEEQQQFEQLVEQQQSDIDNKIQQTLESSDIPHSDYTVARIVHYLRQGLNEGVQLEPADVIDYVEKDYQKDLQQMMSKRNPEKLAEILGEEAMQNLRKADADRIKKQTGQNTGNYHIGKGQSTDDSKSEKQTTREAFGKPMFK